MKKENKKDKKKFKFNPKTDIQINEPSGAKWIIRTEGKKKIYLTTTGKEITL